MPGRCPTPRRSDRLGTVFAFTHLRLFLGQRKFLAGFSVGHPLRELPVVDGNNTVVGFLDEREVARLYLKAEARAGDSSMSLAKDVSSIGLQ